MRTEQAVERQAGLENLTEELIEALDGLMSVADSSLDYRPEFRAAVSHAHSIVAKAKGVQS